MPQTQIKITDDSGRVEPGKEAVILSIKAGDTVQWTSASQSDCTIVFASNDGSPFAKRTFTLKANGSVDSGPLAARKRGGVGVYKYSVMGGAGNNDPIIIVND